MEEYNKKIGITNNGQNNSEFASINSLFLVGGTLLGQAREGRILCHDHDIDLCCFSLNEPLLRSIVNERVGIMYKK